METTDDVEHLSIGEVLAQLQSEFPDVTISKIRFLESQGLIDPERTPSGYRKFYGPDIARLRWILRQQRDHFLPLKVIKSKLEQGDPDDSGFAVQGHLWSEPEASAPNDDTAAAERAAAEAAWPSAAPGRSSPSAAGSSGAPATAAQAASPATAASASAPAAPASTPAASASSPSSGTRHPASSAGTPASSARSAAAPGSGDSGAGDAPASPESSTASSADVPTGSSTAAGESGSGSGSADWLARLQESPRRPAPRPVDPAASPAAGRGLRFGRAEVLEVTGLDDAALDELIQFKLVVPTVIGGEATFDAASVAVVRSLLPFLSRGVQARHLSMFRNAAEREAGFYEQLILPLLKQRNPKAREEATKTLDELMTAGDELGRALVRQALRNHLGE